MELSGRMQAEVPDEKVTLYGDTDRLAFKGGGAWGGVKELCRKHGSREQGVSKLGRKRCRFVSLIRARGSRRHLGYL